MRKILAYSLFATVIPMLLSACLATKTQVSMLHAPEVDAAVGYRSISVSQFSGQYGADVSIALEGAMMNARVQNKPVYRTVSRLPEARSLGKDENAIAATARSIGSDGVLTGEVIKFDIMDSNSTKTEYVCNRYEDSKKFFKKCLSGSNVQYSCIDRYAVLNVQVRLIDAKTGGVSYSESLNKERLSTACKNTKPEDARAMFSELQMAIVSDIMKKIVPHERQMQVEFMDPDRRIVSEASKERFSAALKFIAEQRMDRGCEILRDLYDREKDSVALNYDLGLCEEIEGNFFRANELYRSADRLLNEPDKRITEALARNENDLRKMTMLAKGREDLVKQDKIESGAAPQTIINPNNKSGKSPASLAPVIADDDVLLTGRRSALVIGNAKYRHVSALINPTNDARAMAVELRNAGFTVVAVEDASLEKMNQAIEKFSASIKPGGAALVFYAGHGFQVKGENYLVPVDANLKGESDVSVKTINLGQILTKLEDAKSQVNVVILDACRDNPFAGAWRSAAKRGLASIDAPSGTVIAFATAPGKTASDGSAGNGLFTSHLLQQIRIPNQKLEDVLKNTRKGVAASSGNVQVPWDSSSLTGDFYFRVSQPAK